MELPIDYSGGWLFLWRKILDSDLWTLSPNHIVVGLTCLLRARHEDGTVKGIEVKRGQWLTHRAQIAGMCPSPVTEKVVRRALQRLEGVHFLGRRSVCLAGRRFLLITICKYEEYQNPPFVEGRRKGRRSEHPRADGGPEKGLTLPQQPKQPKQGIEQQQPNTELPSVLGEEFRAHWNSKPQLPEIRAWGPEREEALLFRRRQAEFCDHYREAIDALARSPFHTGQNDRRWCADVDWFLRGKVKGANWLKCWEKESRQGHAAMETSPGIARWLLDKGRPKE